MVGYAHKLIAHELGLTLGTISRLVTRLKAKLGARSRAELLAELRAQPLPEAHATHPELARLTRAERDVFTSVLEGRSNDEIAARRRTSPRTVANQLARVYEKQETSGRTAILACYRGLASKDS